MSNTVTVHGWALHFSGDFSGLVGIVSPDGKDKLVVPFDVLAELVGGAVRDVRAARLEAMTGREYLEAITHGGAG